MLGLEKYSIDDDLLIIAGDNLFDFSLTPFVEDFNHDKRTRIILKQIDDVSEINRFGVVRMDGLANILELEEKPENPKSNLASTGIYLISREDISKMGEYFSHGGKTEGVGYFIQWLISNGGIRGFVCDGNCWDIGTVESLDAVKKLYEKNLVAV